MKAFVDLALSPLGLLLTTLLGLAWLTYLVLRKEPEKRAEAVGNAVVVMPDSAQVRQNDCSDTWLHNIATLEAENIDHGIIVLDCALVYKDFDGAAPYVNFNFHLLNVSVFTVSIERSVEGWIDFAGNRLGGHLKRVDENEIAQKCAHSSGVAVTYRKCFCQRRGLTLNESPSDFQRWSASLDRSRGKRFRHGSGLRDDHQELRSR